MLAKYINGLITCIYGVILDCLAFKSLIPVFADVITDEVNLKKEDEVVAFIVLWIAVSIGASIAILIGKSQIQAAADMEKKNSILTSPTNQSTPVHQSKPNDNWYCPRCGKLNQGYVGSCGCGATKPK